MAKHILIIEDEKHVSNYLSEIFQDAGYETVAASDGDTGLALAAQRKPDLITLDLQMPEGHGTKFYQKMRKEVALAEVPVVVISGQTSPHRAINPNKAFAIVQKPFEPAELVAIVQRAIGEAGA